VTRHAEGEIAREGRRVLRRLAHQGARLTPREDGSYGLSGNGKAALKVASSMVEAFRRRDWLTPAAGEGGHLALSDAGLGWLRRAMADENPFAAQHQLRATREIAGPEGETLLLTVNEAESPLGWLRHRRGRDGKPLITALQFEAGEKLRHDFTLAQLTPRMAVDLSAPVVAGRRGAKSDTALPEMVLAAKQRLRRALSAIGPVLADLALDICCHLTGLEDAERLHGWPRRSAKIVLQIALDRLAEHYGLAPANRTRGRLRAWQAPVDEDASPPAAHEQNPGSISRTG
jgi:hypothetical protein